MSDSHSLHDRMSYNVEQFIDPNQTNYLFHAGDCTNVGKEREIVEFINWYKSLNGFEKKFFIAGNHDFGFEQKGSWLPQLISSENLYESKVVYLEDDTFYIDCPEFTRNIVVYGSPWQPWFFDWAFNLPRNGKEIEEKWNNIPDDTDILITHGPPHGILDYTNRHVRAGCELLAFRVEQLKPLIHTFGHIHNGYGYQTFNDTLFINASICGEDYRPLNKPIVVDIVEEDEKFVIKDIS